METPESIRGFLQASAGFCLSRAAGGAKPYFAVYCDDEEVAAAVHRYFGVGAVYRNRDRLVFRIVRLSELMAVVAQCEGHPLIGAKARRYAQWRKLVLARNEIEHMSDEESKEVVNSLSNNKL